MEGPGRAGWMGPVRAERARARQDGPPGPGPAGRRAAVPSRSRPRSFDSLKSGSTCEADEITSINSFPDEVYELIRTWELAIHKNQAIHRESDSMEMEMLTDSQASESELEPMRRVTMSEPPPKRFSRTFWRSVTRKILRREMENNLEREAMSSSDSVDGSSTPRASH